MAYRLYREVPSLVSWTWVFGLPMRLVPPVCILMMPLTAPTWTHRTQSSSEGGSTHTNPPMSLPTKGTPLRPAVSMALTWAGSPVDSSQSHVGSPVQ